MIMKNTYTFMAVFLISFCLPAISLFAQTHTPATLNVAGGTNTINGQVFEYSIGEMALVHTATATNIVVTQGILQPGEIGTGISDHRLTDGQISVYPNPVDDILNVDANLLSGGSLQLQLFDLNGKLVSQKQVAINSGKENTNLSLSHFAAGSYILNAVFKTGNEYYHQNFKIQKIK